MSRDIILSVIKVSLAFGGNQVLSDVSLDVDRGQLFAIIGPNGAGKTSFFNVLTRLYDADSGAAIFDDRNLFEVGATDLAQAGVMRTFQNILILKELSVLDNVLLGLHTSHRTSLAAAAFGTLSYRREERQRRELAYEALKVVGLEQASDLAAGSLPFGHLRLLELARCIASSPKLILLDEPSAGMTSQEIERLTRTIELIRRTLNPTILLIAHTMKLVMQVSDRILVLDHGMPIAEGTPVEIASNQAVIDAYLGKASDDAAA
ncbi:MAG TPA: ABC transporter ATP-binding protein [Bradyrhizobium sp.]|nr:ABC transporter ATP-binding protein [Bradyrhizobium sp.]